MEEQNSFINPSALLEQFNSLQNQIGQPTDYINKGKEIAGNMLISLGAPFFGERLAKTIGKPFYDSLKQAASGDFSGVLDYAKNKVQNEILPFAKQQLTQEVGKYIPELKDFDLENASLSDLKNAFQKGITNKIRSALPQDIADRLPDNLDTDSLLTSVRQLGADQALKVAKNTLPPDVYSQLEARQDLINDPLKIADVISANVNKAKSNIIDLAKQTQSDVEQRLSGLRNDIISKAQETIKPLQDKVAQLQQARTDARTAYEAAKENITDEYTNATQKLNDFQRANPMATQDDLQPFQDDIANVLQKVRDTKTAFLTSDKDLASQLDGAKSMLQSNTELLQSKLSGLRNQLTNKVSQLKQTVQELPQTAQEQVARVLPQPTPQPSTAPQPEQRLNIQEPEVDIRPQIAEYRSPVPDEPEPGLFENFKTWAKKTFTRQSEPVTRRSEDFVEQDGQGFKARLMSPDEPENAFSENALRFKNPALEVYYGSELTPPSQLLGEPSRQLPVRRMKKPKQPKPTEEEQRPAEPSTGQVEPTQSGINEAIARGAAPTQPGAPGAQNVLPDELRQQMEQRAAQQPQAEQPSTQPSTQPSEQPITEQPPAAQAQLAEQPPAPTQQPSQPALSEQPSVPEPITAEPDLETTISQTIEKGTQKAASISQKVASGLDEAAAATEEIPVADILMDTAGLLASIFGGKALLGGSQKLELPSVSGAVYEPNL